MPKKRIEKRVIKMEDGRPYCCITRCSLGTHENKVEIFIPKGDKGELVVLAGLDNLHNRLGRDVPGLKAVKEVNGDGVKERLYFKDFVKKASPEHLSVAIQVFKFVPEAKQFLETESSKQ